MSDLQKRMQALSNGGAVDVIKVLARSPADLGGSVGTRDVEPRARVDRHVGLG